MLTNWSRVTHICVNELISRRQVINWTNSIILLIRTSGTNFSEILSEIHTFSFKKMHWKCRYNGGHFPGLNILTMDELCVDWLFQIWFCISMLNRQHLRLSFDMVPLYILPSNPAPWIPSVSLYSSYLQHYKLLYCLLEMLLLLND